MGSVLHMKGVLGTVHTYNRWVDSTLVILNNDIDATPTAKLNADFTHRFVSCR